MSVTPTTFTSSSSLLHSYCRLQQSATRCSSKQRLRWTDSKNKIHHSKKRCHLSSSSSSSNATPVASSIHQKDYYWKTLMERSNTFIQQMENRSTALHPGVANQTIQGLLRDVATYPIETGCDVQQHLGPIADKLLELANMGTIENDENVALLLDLFDLAIEAWIRSEHSNGLDEAEKYLWKILLNSRVMQSNDEPLQDRINDSFAKVLHAFASKMAAPDEDEEEGQTIPLDQYTNRVQKLIDFMQQNWDDPNVPISANTTAMNGVLNTLCKRGMASNALSLLRVMADRQDGGDSRIAPNNVSFGTVISSFAKRGDVQAARSVLDWMTRRYVSDSRHILVGIDDNNINTPNCPKPTTVEYTSILDAWANSGRPDAGVEAENLFMWMLNQDDANIKPNAQSYSIAINAWAKTPTAEAAERAEKILRHMIHQQERHGMELDEAAVLVSLTTVVDAWSRSSHPESTERAASIVAYMEQLGHPGLSPNERTYTALIKAWGAKATKESRNQALLIWQRMKERGVQPSTQTFNSLLQAMIRSGPSGASEAFDLFLHAEQQYASGDRTLTIDAVSFNMALNALVKCTRSDAIDLADSLLARMMHYETADATNTIDATEHRIQPNTVTFNTIMTLLLKHGTHEYDRAEEVQNLLFEMEESSQPCRLPNSASYTICIRAWAQSSDPQKLRRARDILNRMEAAYERGVTAAKPTTAAYNAVLHACRFPILTELTTYSTTLTLAIETFNRLRQLKYTNPDELTYVTILNVLGRSSKAGTSRETLIEQAFLSCRKDGLVGDAVLRELQYVSTFVYDKYVTSQLEEARRDGLDGCLPLEWRRNVKAVAKDVKSKR